MLPSKLQKPTMSIDEVNHEGGVFVLYLSKD